MFANFINEFRFDSTNIKLLKNLDARLKLSTN